MLIHSDLLCTLAQDRPTLQTTALSRPINKASMEICYNNGIHLPGPQLWLDPHAAQPCAVVSHAHADHIQCHERVLCSASTAAMMRLRGALGCKFQTLPYRQPVETGAARVTLYPAGHILGSAQVLVEWQGVRLLYSGDFKLRPGLSAEPIEVPPADIVIMETTFGKPQYCFPEAEAVVNQIKEFCVRSLRDGEAPILFCYSLGKGQEVLAGLAGVDFPIYLHTAHWQMASLYREFGVKLPFFRKYQPGQKLDGVLLCASGCRRGAWFAGLGRIRTAYVSGWALDPGACRRFGTDAAFALSDHAGYDDLKEYARLTGAQTIYTVHGFTSEFAAALRRDGYQAQPLGAHQALTSNQLRLF
ncbi:MAG TPA: hypothetical protein VNA16_07485 [Abditibacteriaceae bacterium]|nr:hypothetical protein [Abditibacteriaceae bacterium]